MAENISLRPYNSFGIDCQAAAFARLTDPEELDEMLEQNGSRSLLVLGGGSNILFTRDFPGLVIKNEIRGITELHEDNDYVYVRAGAGENWHEFVQYCIDRNWTGLENLSLIPGCVGASPMQNIGAYGVEVEDLFWDLEAYHLKDRSRVTFTASDCRFGYRDSIFKQQYRDQFLICQVTFRLNKKPRFNTSYGAIEAELQKMGIQELSARAIADAVIRIRSSKLPDPKQLGNAGSFFKNPMVTAEKAAELLRQFPGMVQFPGLNGQVKLAAGWLIEHCGPETGSSWKGYRIGDAGCHERQALVLVNHGNASGKEILDLSEAISLSVFRKFEVKLEREVNII